MAEASNASDLAGLLQRIQHGQFASLIMLHGEEEFLISRAFSAIEDAVLKGIPKSFNFDQFQGGQCDIQRVVDSAQTLPVMAPRRLVVLKEVQDVKEAALEILNRYVAKPNPSTVLLMTGHAVGTKRKLMDAVRKGGIEFQARRMYDRQIRPWIRAEVQQLGKTITEDGIDFLMEMIGENLRDLYGEVIKACLYIGQKNRITLQELQEIISDIGLDTVYAFCAAVGQKRAGEALLLLSRLTEGEPDAASFRALSSLHRHFQQLYQARYWLDKHLQAKEVAAKLGVKENIFWRWEKEALPQAKKRSLEEVGQGLELISRVEYAQRTSRAPKLLLVENLVLRLCSK